jgi:hypothetical protein
MRFRQSSTDTESSRCNRVLSYGEQTAVAVLAKFRYAREYVGSGREPLLLVDPPGLDSVHAFSPRWLYLELLHNLACVLILTYQTRYVVKPL